MRFSPAALAMLALMAAAPIAGGHISVLPEQAVVRESTDFTIRVPAEGGLTTNSVKVLFPPQVTVYAIADAPGWDTQVLRRPDGRIRGAQWTGGAIPPDRYADFSVLGTPFEEGVTVWRSEQGTTNGQVKKRTGPVETGGSVAPETGPDRPGPAAAVTVGAEPVVASGTGGGGSVWPGVIGIALGALALVGVGLLWASRPATLPPDGPEDGPAR